jgi:hypothetical protein
MAYDEVGDGRARPGELQWRMSDSMKPGDKSLYILRDRVYSYMREVRLLQSPGLQTVLFVLGFLYEHSRHTRQSVQKKLVASLRNMPWRHKQ